MYARFSVKVRGVALWQQVPHFCLRPKLATPERRNMITKCFAPAWWLSRSKQRQAGFRVQSDVSYREDDIGLCSSNHHELDFRHSWPSPIHPVSETEKAMPRTIVLTYDVNTETTYHSENFGVFVTNSFTKVNLPYHRISRIHEDVHEHELI